MPTGALGCLPTACLSLSVILHGRSNGGRSSRNLPVYFRLAKSRPDALVDVDDLLAPEHDDRWRHIANCSFVLFAKALDLTLSHGK